MKLEDCKFGRMVITDDLAVGFIKGFTYNCSIELTGNMSPEEKFQRTIVMVSFPYGKRSIHPSNINPFP